MADETPGLPDPADSSSEVNLPYPDEVLFAPPRRSVVHRPVFRHKRLKSLYARGVRFTRIWSVYRVVVGLFCVFAFGLIGVGVADAFFCPEGTAARFWEGCLWETIGFGSGGGLFGFTFFLYIGRALDRSTLQKPDQSPDSENSANSASQSLEGQ